MKRIVYIFFLNGEYGIAESINSPEAHPYPSIGWQDKTIIATYVKRHNAEKRLAKLQGSKSVKPIEPKVPKQGNLQMAKSATANKDNRLHKFTNISGETVIGTYSELKGNAKELLGISYSSVRSLKEGRTDCVKGWTYAGIEPIGFNK